MNKREAIPALKAGAIRRLRAADAMDLYAERISRYGLLAEVQGINFALLVLGDKDELDYYP